MNAAPQESTTLSAAPLLARPSAPSARVDAVAAPAPASALPATARARDVVEAVVADVYRDVLEVAEVDVEAGLVEQGGDSLAAARVLARLAEIFPVQLTLPDVLEARSVRGLSALLRRRGDDAGVDAAEVGRLLREVEALNDEEVEARLLASHGPLRRSA